MEPSQLRALLYAIHNLGNVQRNFFVFPEVLGPSVCGEKYTQKWHLSNQKDYTNFVKALEPLRAFYTRKFQKSETRLVNDF